LLLAEKDLEHDSYFRWSHEYHKASLNIENKEENMNTLAEEIERDLILLGSTGIEDKLQEDVGETIEAIKGAGIKLWVLTGDKVETAINIGYAAKILNNDMF
jgi:phospholipid-transporting ATPase